VDRLTLYGLAPGAVIVAKRVSPGQAWNSLEWLPLDPLDPHYVSASPDPWLGASGLSGDRSFRAGPFLSFY
jgi:hypothetical protein